mgnify:CR=1 FL=1
MFAIYSVDDYMKIIIVLQHMDSDNETPELRNVLIQLIAAHYLHRGERCEFTYALVGDFSINDVKDTLG